MTVMGLVLSLCFSSCRAQSLSHHSISVLSPSMLPISKSTHIAHPRGSPEGFHSKLRLFCLNVATLRWWDL